MPTLTLLPVYEDLHIDAISQETAAIVLRISINASSARCPNCGTYSQRVHSRYRRIRRQFVIAVEREGGRRRTDRSAGLASNYTQNGSTGI